MITYISFFTRVPKYILLISYSHSKDLRLRNFKKLNSSYLRDLVFTKPIPFYGIENVVRYFDRLLPRYVALHQNLTHYRLNYGPYLFCIFIFLRPFIVYVIERNKFLSISINLRVRMWIPLCADNMSDILFLEFLYYGFSS